MRVTVMECRPTSLSTSKTVPTRSEVMGEFIRHETHQPVCTHQEYAPRTLHLGTADFGKHGYSPGCTKFVCLVSQHTHQCRERVQQVIRNYEGEGARLVRCENRRVMWESGHHVDLQGSGR